MFRIRLPHKRFALMRTDHFVRVTVPEGYFWLKRSARRALHTAQREMPQDDWSQRYTWMVIPWGR